MTDPRQATIDATEAMCAAWDDDATSIHDVRLLVRSLRDTLPALRASLAETPAGWTREHHIALREGHCWSALDDYFMPRPVQDDAMSRRAFEAGFERGFDKAAELLAAAPSLPASGTHPTMTRDELVAAAESIGMRFPASAPPAAEPSASAPAASETVPWPTVTRYSGGASPEGVAGRVWIRLSDEPEETEYVPAPAASVVEVLRNFEITGPDDDGLVWLVLHGSGTTGQAMFNLGVKGRLATQVALMLEQDRRAALSTPHADRGMVPLTEEQIEALRGLDTDKRVRFYEHDFYVLSNFSAFTLVWKGIRFDTSEAAYHYEKFPERHDIGGAILYAPSAHEAFKVAERNKAHRRPDWDDVKVSIMRGILRAKADQHEYVRRKLLATGDRELVEDSWRDDFWGWGPNRDGKNTLGRLWMEVRAELRAHGITGSGK